MSSILERDKKYVWHPFGPLKGVADPLPVVRAKNCSLFLEDGREILDAISSWWVNPLGHAQEDIARAGYEQMLRCEHVIFAGFTHEPAVNLAERLIQLSHQNFKKVFFSDNGSTSVEVALKMAIQYHFNLGKPRKKIISFKDAYHGDTFGAMAVGQKSSFFVPFEDFTFDVLQMELPSEKNWAELKKQFADWVANEDVAAFIFEPLLLGAGGMKMYAADHLKELIALAKKHNTLCIADEVMTGFGRTGKMFACGYLDEIPDLLCLSKCLTGGFMPLSVTLANEKVVNAFDNPDKSKAFYHGHSYTGNPVACAIANKTLELLDSDETRAAWKMIENFHQAFAEKLKHKKEVENVRVLGTVLAFEVKDKTSGYFSSIRDFLYENFLNQGILLRPLGNTVYIMPPFTISEYQLDSIYAAIENTLKKLSAA
ncbi:MAG: adenosylmethionine--8-amino-7-oxononanoate transaminase [Luteibaculum sp.]